MHIKGYSCETEKKRNSLFLEVEKYRPQERMMNSYITYITYIYSKTYSPELMINVYCKL